MIYMDSGWSQSKMMKTVTLSLCLGSLQYNINTRPKGTVEHNS